VHVDRTCHGQRQHRPKGKARNPPGSRVGRLANFHQGRAGCCHPLAQALQAFVMQQIVS